MRLTQSSHPGGRTIIKQAANPLRGHRQFQNLHLPNVFTNKQHRLGGGTERDATRYYSLKYLSVDDGETCQQKDNSCSESVGNILNDSIFYHMLNYRKHKYRQKNSRKPKQLILRNNNVVFEHFGVRLDECTQCGCS